MYTLSDFDFDLPPELIAQHALARRSASRLLDVNAGRAPLDRHFDALPDCLEAGDLLVFNDTKVINARLFGVKASGGRVEVLIERITGTSTALAQIRASKSPAPGTILRLADAFTVAVGARVDDFYTLHFPEPCAELIERHGQLPLPPYITHKPDASDASRYQTVYARHPGAVAAPTAGLHFDEALLGALDARGIRRATLTLHVGAGTFQPVRTEHIEQHKMHSEWYEIGADLVAAIDETRRLGKRVIAVGTTSLRALEAAARDHAARLGDPVESDGDGGSALTPCRAQTDIFITPGYRFRIVQRLITNFHLPKSTLMMLVCAFAGYDTIQAAYRHAIAERYRFFSYGDAMLLNRLPC